MWLAASPHAFEQDDGLLPVNRARRRSGLRSAIVSVCLLLERIHAQPTRARVARMRRVVGILVLVLIVFGAVWCVDGCVDPLTRSNAPLQSSSASTCVVCVVPFTTTSHFSLRHQGAVTRVVAHAPVVHFWAAPTFSIDHPPRSL